MDAKEHRENLPACRTITIDESALVLGISRSTAYKLARYAEGNNGYPFKVIRIGGSLRISAKSFNDYLHELGL